jgi:hypothetical protein
MSKLIATALSLLVVFGMSLLIIPAVGIVVGLIKKTVFLNMLTYHLNNKYLPCYVNRQKLLRN